jgi:NADH-quinone oxidoreductase subunit N
VIVAFHGADVRLGDFGWAPVAAWVAMISMVIGNFTALVQKNVKRMLAYSSVAHAGYLLLGVAGIGYTADSSQASAIVFYVFAYTAATVGAFGVLAHFARRNEEAESFDDLNGLGHRFPLIGLAMALFMLSAAGLPPTAGFVGKFLLFRNALAASATAEHGGTMLLSLATVGILTSVVSAYAYLRVIAHLYMVPATREVRELPSSGARFAVIVCAVVTLLAGILPGRLMKTADSAAQQIEGHPNGAYLVDNGD